MSLIDQQRKGDAQWQRRKLSRWQRLQVRMCRSTLKRLAIAGIEEAYSRSQISSREMHEVVAIVTRMIDEEP